MKKILITGDHSYIGESLSAFLQRLPGEYETEELCMIGDDWKAHPFKGYDAVVHVAGIAHIKETPENAHLYDEVNRLLAIETAKKTKEAGVPHFILMSSMSVYGIDTGIITRDTVPAPVTNYGKSKLAAEEGILPLADDSFKVCVLRPPMVYGKGCKGNFQSVIRLVEKLPAFPKIDNRRSMIYIDNLCGFIRLVLDRQISGVRFPQNRETMNTTEMAGWIAEGLGKKFRESGFLGFGVKILMPFVKAAKKGFGSLIYQDLEDFDYCYCTKDSRESVISSV